MMMVADSVEVDHVEREGDQAEGEPEDRESRTRAERAYITASSIPSCLLSFTRLT